MTGTGASMLFTRRRFLAVGVALVAMPHVARASTLASGQRKLSFDNPHTGETLTTVYWTKGDYVGEALREVNYIMRDFRTGDVHGIDPRLLDLLHALHGKLDSRKSFEIISGYRSPQTNAKLAELSNGVAKHSLHMKGMAIDINLPDVRLKNVRKAAIALKKGGVGYYPNSHFVHVDVGRVRTW
jgi:uncharacterized protein YcbK (DUF882 family)